MDCKVQFGCQGPGDARNNTITMTITKHGADLKSREILMKSHESLQLEQYLLGYHHARLNLSSVLLWLWYFFNLFIFLIKFLKLLEWK
jgi:hypothetical protein